MQQLDDLNRQDQKTVERVSHVAEKATYNIRLYYSQQTVHLLLAF